MGEPSEEWGERVVAYVVAREAVDLTPRATEVLIDLKLGTATATILTNDLTHDYVHENSAYST